MNPGSTLRQGFLPLICALMLGCLPTQAAVPEVETYAECLDAVERDPREGLTAALQWRDLGGGTSAEHCAALALSATGSRRLAAVRMQELAERFGVGSPDMAAEIMGQAGALWVLAREDELALKALDRALVWRGNSSLLHLDRAHVLAGLGRFREARDAVGVVLSIDELSAAAYALRAMINRREGDREGADSDIANALALEPDQPHALIERARAQAASGDLDGARADLLAVINQDAEAPEAEDARRLLEELDVSGAD
ncbi:MAG: hypothetical protein P1U65_06585 [Minwuia sp.]|nr:hypothetical protein [Minwuia sp.]